MENNLNDLEWTGERLVTSLGYYYVTIEHLHRYALAREISRDKIVLDIACGEGYGSFLLSQVADYVYGVDIDTATVTHANSKYGKFKNNLCFKTGSTSSIPLPDNSVDMVASFETIEHHDEHEQMMREIKRVLKPSGKLIISSPDKDRYRKLDPHNPFHIKELHFVEFKNLMNHFFKHCQYYQQCFVAGSLITPVEQDSTAFSTYDGDYSSIGKGLHREDYFNNPYYNLAICSDEAHDCIEMTSLFNGVKAILTERHHSLERGRQQVLKSTSYKIGNWFVRKAFFLKRGKRK